jgi:hypothetical protein
MLIKRTLKRFPDIDFKFADFVRANCCRFGTDAAVQAGIVELGTFRGEAGALSLQYGA